MNWGMAIAMIPTARQVTKTRRNRISKNSGEEGAGFLAIFSTVSNLIGSGQGGILLLFLNQKNGKGHCKQGNENNSQTHQTIFGNQTIFCSHWK